MPYNLDDKNLPDSIKKLSKKLRAVWVNIWNATFKKYKDESKAFKMANGAIKKLKADGALFEIHSEVGAVREVKELTPEDFKSYGVNASFGEYRPNCKIIEGRLFAADIPFCPSSEGITEGYNFILSKKTVEASLWQLNNMPVHVNSELSGHAEEEDGDKKYVAIGTILGSKMTQVGEENWVDVLCGLWDTDHEKEVAAITAKKDELGMSIEMFFDPETIEAVDYNLLKVNDVSHKGLAILQKSRAAFPQTQLLVASNNQVDKSVYNIGETKNEVTKNMDMVIKSDGTTEGTELTVAGKVVKGMQNITFSFWNIEDKPYFNYSVVEKEKDGFVVTKSYLLSAEGIKEVGVVKNQVTPLPEEDTAGQKAKIQGGEIIMDYKGIELNKETYTPQEILDLLKPLDSKDEHTKILAEKDTKIEELQAAIDARTAEDAKAEEKKAGDAKIEAEKTAVAEAEKWFEENKGNYLPDNKKEIVEIRAKIELGTATKEETLKLAELKKQSGSLSAPTGDETAVEEQKLDNLFGIKSAIKK